MSETKLQANKLHMQMHANETKTDQNDSDMIMPNIACNWKCWSPLNRFLFLKPATKCFDGYQFPLIKSFIWKTHSIWYMSIPPSRKRPEGFRDDIDVVLFFHPITTNIVHMYERIEEMSEQVPLCYYHMLCIEYPGYASSCDTTYSSEHTFLTQYPLYVLACLQREKLSIKRSIVIGYSMGTALASFLAAYCPWVKGLILLAPFSSINDVVRDFAHGMHFLVEDRFPTHIWIQNVKCPLYLVHGLDDETISFAHSMELFDAATRSSYRRLTLVNGLGHVDLCSSGQCISYGVDAFYTKEQLRSSTSQSSPPQSTLAEITVVSVHTADKSDDFYMI